MRRTAEADDLSDLLLAVLGPTAQITDLDRLRGGTKKGVYRVHLTGHTAPSVIVYSWADDENFWPDPDPVTTDPDDPFQPASGLDRFLLSQHTLEQAGVRTPHLYQADHSREHYPADVAVVEDFPTGTLEHLLKGPDRDLALQALRSLKQTLDRMRTVRSPQYGIPGHLRPGQPCEHHVLDHALGHLDDAAGREPRLAAVVPAMRERLHELHARITPRSDHSLIHGELGPDHVLVDPTGQAVLVDIEGTMIYDAEWEHVFLELRFHDDYPLLADPTLDPARLDLYRLAIRLSLVAGPLRLLDGDFPHRKGMQDIAESNLQAALTLLPRSNHVF